MNFVFRNIASALNTSVRRSNGARNFHRWLAPTLRELYKRKQKMNPVEPSRRSEFLEWNYDAELYAFSKRVGEDFNSDFLRTALIEKSFIVKEEQRQRDVGIEPESPIEDNSSMATDGEKLISAYVSNYLESILPNLPENYIGKLKAFLISEEVLARISKGVGINDIVLCGDAQVSNSSLARSFKSVVQALALSQGAERAHRFVRDLVLVELVGKDLTEFCTPEKPMETLQSVLSDIGAEPAEPRLIAEVASNTVLANFQVGIYSSKKMIGRGSGEAIDIATDMAACDALWRKWGVLSQSKPFPFNLELQPKLTAGNRL